MGPCPHVLVWGPAITDQSPLAAGGGPIGGHFRQAVCDRLTAKLPAQRIGISEHGPYRGHHRSNPGFYQPHHVRESRAIVLILPGHREKAANTWELALALDDVEHDLHGRALRMRLRKLVFVVPKMCFDYLMDHLADPDGPQDLAAPRLHPLPEETPLGPGSSFALRQIYAAFRSTLVPLVDSLDAGAGLPGNDSLEYSDAINVVAYPDDRKVELIDRDLQLVMAEIEHRVQRLIGAPH